MEEARREGRTLLQVRDASGAGESGETEGRRVVGGNLREENGGDGLGGK